MTINEIFRELSGKNVSIAVGEKGKLIIEAPRGVLTEALKGQIKAQKSKIIERLSRKNDKILKADNDGDSLWIDIIKATESAQARSGVGAVVYPAIIYTLAHLGRPDLPAILAPDGYYKIYVKSAVEMRAELLRTTPDHLRTDYAN